MTEDRHKMKDRIIYISDLDGTLLNSNQEIPVGAKEKLNRLIEEEKVHFSVATARTPATVELIMKGVKVKEPIIVMNGVAMYDLQKHQYIQVEYIEPDLVKKVLLALGEWIDQGFIYTIDQNRLTVHYNKLVGQSRINFYEERKNLYYKKFERTPLNNDKQVIYFVFIDSKENIQTIYDLLQGIEGLGMVMYKDLYSKEGYLLEVYSYKATKANGIKKLKAFGAYNKVICFGDQLNDLNMFQVADEAYAVANAVEEVKNIATAIIGSNEEESVACFIEQHAEKRRENEGC